MSDSRSMRESKVRPSANGSSARNVNEFDDHVGKRIRAARKARGFSQSQFGAPLGISFQQIQKYESGTNRVSAGRLFEMATLLDVDVSYFFEGLKQGSDPRSPLPVVMGSAEDLYAKFCNIKSAGVRKHVLKLVSVLSHSEEQ